MQAPLRSSVDEDISVLGLLGGDLHLGLKKEEKTKRKSLHSQF
jgi:hypothetical protein